MHFDYLLDKIANSKFEKVPFRHLEINNFFNASDFEKIVKDNQIATLNFNSDLELITALENSDYVSIDFPGTIRDKEEYIKWHSNRYSNELLFNEGLCEGFGMTFRLNSIRSQFLKDLASFFCSIEFKRLLAEKFKINLSDVYLDTGIQKYLDGYEISPHPDIRRKALTFMANINPHQNSEELNHHTSYLVFKDKYKYIEHFWRGNPDLDRCWVPWDWCDIIKSQNLNNSIIFFAPDDNSVHGVKLDYNHLKSQRTQIYGNFWYNEMKQRGRPSWVDFEIDKF